MTPTADTAFRALADPTRRRLLELLAAGRSSFGELSDELPVSDAAVSQQLRQLREARLVDRHQDGRRSSFVLRADGFAPVVDWLSRYERLWDDALGRLDAVVATSRDDEDAP